MLTLDRKLDAKIIEALETNAPGSEECEGGIINPLFNTLICRNTLHDFARTATGLEQRMYLTAIMYGYKVIDNHKYVVKVPHTNSDYYHKAGKGISTMSSVTLHIVSYTDLFTLDEINKYGLEDCERIEFNGKVVQ